MTIDTAPVSARPAGDADPAFPAAAPTFAGLDLPAELLATIDTLGFTTPTEIQAATIPALLDGRDVTGVAQTGTGKTAAFALPMLARLDPAARRVQALVLVPTRELAIQVADAIESMAPRGYAPVLTIYGGAPYGPQLRGLSAGAQVVVGTPGRVIDMLDKRALDLSELGYLVLDEADEMLRMGFAEDVDRILASAAPTRQTALFSATMPRAIRAVAREHMNDPVEVATSRPSSTTTTITQTYAVVPFRHKIGALARVLATSDAEAAVVFVRTRQTAEEVAGALLERGVSAAAISGDVAQKDRERIIERLRTGLVQVLVATDVAARGMDVDRIGLVVNFDIPREAEAYVHRIGRTGRAGREGRALTFFTPRERGRLRMIERHTGATMTETTIPTPAQVSEHRARRALATVPERVTAGRLDLYRELLTAQFGEDDLLDAAAALLARSVGDDGPQRARDEEEIPTHRFDSDTGRFADRDQRRNGPRGGSRSGGPAQFSGPGTVYRVAVGHTHGVRPQDIVGAITGEGGLRGSDLGKISIFSRFSLVQITTEVGAESLRRIGAARVAGQQLRIRPDEGPRGRAGGERPRRDGYRRRGPDSRRGPGARRDGFRRKDHASR
ncbi:DEAD/DEAH box helicase [Ruania albidiflava]|uniref:DEAD/DEAH box helicase n=1 Tax=Ruania albidiflava TaxID=366586 RepID=UPI0023F487D4|nr:DEAD/DEAH box helicase [Ruania albidiflava]